MTLTCKFKKEKLDNGMYISRPRILVEITGKYATIIVPALIDSACDTTVIPESIASAIGLDLSGEKDKLFAFRESNEVILSKATITFLGKEHRSSVKISAIPVLVALSEEGINEEEDITLG